MWLLPALSLVSGAAARAYYRLTIAGAPVPASGPVLLVANHPNSLLDPVLVAAAAGRPVRFLAKAPLFDDRAVGWLVRGAGAIPVYRRVDDPAEIGRNVDMFRAVHEELIRGAAVGVFPEGLTHDEPEIAQLKTGAARIALGAATRDSNEFPIVPVGLVLRKKDVFRSEALIVRGAPVDWHDLAGKDSGDHDTVRELTRRIDAAMRRVTVNLERWEDRPLVECAEAIWTAEWGGDPDPARQIARLELTTSALKTLRQNAGGGWARLEQDVATHCRDLRLLRLKPASLAVDVSLSAGLKWSARRFPLVGIPAFALAALGYFGFWPPRRATGLAVRLAAPDRYRRSTYALLIGIPVYAVWIVSLGAVLWGFGGYRAATVGGLLLPVAGGIGLWIRERWRVSMRDIRSFFLLRSRRKLVESLRARQRGIAEGLKESLDRLRGAGIRGQSSRT